MGRALRVLIIEDSEGDAVMLVRELKRGGYDLTYERVDTELAMASVLAQGSWDLVLSDYAMPQFSAEGAACLVARAGLDLPLIVVSGAVGEEEAAAVMRAGAQDFILKKNLRRLLPAIERELKAAQTRRDKRRVDETLNYERGLLRQLMEGTPDAIFFKDPQRRYMHLNDAERLMLGIPRGEEVLGKTADVFISPERARMRREVEEKVLSTGEPRIDCIEKIVAANGESRWFSTTMAPIRGSYGDVAGLVGIARDITESKRQEQMKNEFISTVSHELRTPLTSIMGAVGFLTGGSVAGLPASAGNLLKIAHSNCQRLARIVNDILDIQKIESGQMAWVRKPVDVCALAEQIIEANQGFAQHHGVAVRLDGASVRAFVLADPDRLDQVIANLLSNAIKFSPLGAEVVVTIGSTDDAVRISVRDRGRGVPDHYKGRIFEKFVQVDATDARREGGTGLGLSIAKQITVILGGDIGVEDAPGGGTIFHITLPRLHRGVERDGAEMPANSDPLGTGVLS